MRVVVKRTRGSKSGGGPGSGSVSNVGSLNSTAAAPSRRSAGGGSADKQVGVEVQTEKVLIPFEYQERNVAQMLAKFRFWLNVVKVCQVTRALLHRYCYLDRETSCY